MSLPELCRGAHTVAHVEPPSESHPHQIVVTRSGCGHTYNASLAPQVGDRAMACLGPQAEGFRVEDGLYAADSAEFSPKPTVVKTRRLRKDEL